MTVLDLGDNQAHQYEISTDRATFERFLKQLQPSDKVAFESWRNCRYYYTRIRPLVQEVLVANPKKLRWIAEQLRRREGSYRNLYRRVNRRSGHSSAVVACGRKVLEAVWCMLTREQTFHEESPNLTKRKLAKRGVRLAAARSKAATTRKEARETIKMRIGLLAELAGAGLEATPLPPRLLSSFGRRPKSPRVGPISSGGPPPSQAVRSHPLSLLGT